MITNSTRKKILVLSDDDRLARAIELILGGWVVEKLALSAAAQQTPQLEMSTVGLIVIALSSPANEPAAALNLISLIDQAGQNPLLIISEKRIRPRPDNLAAQMNFPFDVDEFRDKVLTLLQTGGKNACLAAS
jgi:hypothetical protein